MDISSTIKKNGGKMIPALGYLHYYELRMHFMDGSNEINTPLLTVVIV